MRGQNEDEEGIGYTMQGYARRRCRWVGEAQGVWLFIHVAVNGEEGCEDGRIRRLPYDRRVDGTLKAWRRAMSVRRPVRL